MAVRAVRCADALFAGGRELLDSLDVSKTHRISHARQICMQRENYVYNILTFMNIF